MKARYHLTTRDRKLFIEAPHTKEGRKELEKTRRELPQLLKGKHIKSIIQAQPSKIEELQFYRYGQIV